MTPDTRCSAWVWACPTLAGWGWVGLSHQVSPWSPERYWVPVTDLQVPGSSPVTLTERPTSVPVTVLP